MKKGGAAKGELVLAIFELANCFRNGWGIEKDPFAAKQVRLKTYFTTSTICYSFIVKKKAKQLFSVL